MVEEKDVGKANRHNDVPFIPTWARSVPRPWRSFEAPRGTAHIPPAQQTVTFDLSALIPVDVTVPADTQWHQLPDPSPRTAQPAAASYSLEHRKRTEVPGGQEVSSRRAGEFAICAST